MTTEQETKVAENDKNVSETEEKETSAEVAEQESQASEAEGAVSKETTPKHTFQTDEELENHIGLRVEREAQSMKDKELDPVRHQLRVANEENERLKQETSSGVLDQLIKKLAEDGDTKSVDAFQTARTIIAEDTVTLRKNRAAVQVLQKEVAEAKEETDRSEAFNLYIKYVLPDGEKMVKEAKDFIDHILTEGKTKREKELLARVRASEISKGKTPVKSHKPETSRSSAPGGVNTSTLSAEDRVTKGLEDKKRKNKE